MEPENNNHENPENHNPEHVETSPEAPVEEGQSEGPSFEPEVAEEQPMEAQPVEQPVEEARPEPEVQTEQPLGEQPEIVSGQEVDQEAKSIKTLGVLSLIFGFFVSLVGLILGIVGKSKEKAYKARTGQTPEGSGLLTAGIIVSAIMLGIGIITAVIVTIAMVGGLLWFTGSTNNGNGSSNGNGSTNQNPDTPDIEEPGMSSERYSLAGLLSFQVPEGFTLYEDDDDNITFVRYNRSGMPEVIMVATADEGGRNASFRQIEPEIEQSWSYFADAPVLINPEYTQDFTSQGGMNWRFVSSDHFDMDGTEWAAVAAISSDRNGSYAFQMFISVTTIGDNGQAYEEIGAQLAMIANSAQGY